MERFDAYYRQCGEAVDLLHTNNMWVQAASLVYLYMDHMAWLSVDGKNTPADFKSWVDKYMIDINPVGCTSNDLWESRNALVHMGTSESDKFIERGARQVLFYRKMPRPIVAPGQNVVFVDVDTLIHSYLTGILFFRSDVEADTPRKPIVDEKLKKLMFNTPV